MSEGEIFTWKTAYFSSELLGITPKFVKITDAEEFSYFGGSGRTYFKGLCVYCGSDTIITKLDDHWRFGTEELCSFCGYSRNEYEQEAGARVDIRQEKFLLQLEINSAELSFAELGVYLSNHFEKVLYLSPRRFELLVADVFKNEGFSVEVTKQTRDGGADLILLDKNGQKIIVEVKRYKKKIGVGPVRQLRGVQLRDNTKRAILLTSGYFTKDAKTEAEASFPSQYGFELSLMDAEDLLRMLNIYKNSVPLSNILRNGLEFNKEKLELIKSQNKRWHNPNHILNHCGRPIINSDLVAPRIIPSVGSFEIY